MNYILSLLLARYTSWWGVALFLLICAILFEQAVHKRNVEYAKLSAQLHELQITKNIALAEQAELLAHINSESDPAWVEMVLMQNLGLVPENHSKVYFHK